MLHDVVSSIRPLVDTDLDRVLEINQANVPEVGHLDLDRLRFIVGQCSTALVVEVDQDVVGFCLVLAPGSTYDSANYTYFMDRYDDAWYLDRVAFEAAAQGRGVGTQLYAEVDLVAAQHAGRLTLEVNVNPPNEASLAFHAKHGYVEVGRQMSHGVEVSLQVKQY